jgi:hypothetical protein
VTLQDVSITILENALGILPADTDKIVLLFGVSSAGTPATLYPITDSESLAAIGYGPGPETCRHFVDEGAQVYFCPVTAGTAGSNSSVAQAAGSPPAVGLTGAPYDFYKGHVKMTAGGAVGTSKFQYSLDDGETWSQEIVTASTYPVPNTGLTITFAAGTYVLADEYTWTSTAPYYTTSNLNTAFDAAIADPREWGLVYVSGAVAGATESDKATNLAGVIAAVGTKMAAAATAFRFARAIVEAADFADSGAALISAATTIAQTRVACVAGFGKVLSPVTGRKNMVSYGRVLCSKLGKKPIGKDPSQIAAEAGTGAMPSALLSLKHDERKTPGLDTARFVTARTYIGRTGFYVTNFPLMSSPGSDFKYLQHGQVMDNACKTARNAMLPYLSRDLEVEADGTLSESEAQNIEEDVGGQVRASVVQPGHATAATIVANRTDVVLTTEKLRAKVRVQPKFYPKAIELELGFTRTVPATT